MGRSFGFDGEMRAFSAGTDGSQTMQDALEHYRATRGQRAAPIDPQFEITRFTRTWHQAHLTGTREDALRDWRAYRERPVDARGRAGTRLTHRRGTRGVRGCRTTHTLKRNSTTSPSTIT